MVIWLPGRCLANDHLAGPLASIVVAMRQDITKISKLQPRGFDVYFVALGKEFKCQLMPDAKPYGSADSLVFQVDRRTSRTHRRIIYAL